MSVDEFALRREAKDLAGLYRELDAGKFAQQRQPEVRTMKPSPGPRSPAPDHLVSLDEELTSRLFEMVSEVRSHIRPTLILTKNGMRLCSFLAFNAQAVSELDVAPDLMDEMKDQAHRIKRIVAPLSPAEVAQAPEKYVDIETITRNLGQRGYQVTSRQARDVAAYQQFDTCKFTDGKNGYKLTQFLTHYQQ